MPLTNIECQRAKPSEKTYKLFDGRGLYLEVRPNGAKYWRIKYRYGGKEKLYSIGVYPGVSLSQARGITVDVKELLATGIDPSAQKQGQKEKAVSFSDNTFEVIARRWHDTFKDTWKPAHAQTIMARLERNIFPEIGKMLIPNIKPAHIIGALQKVEQRGAHDAAHRIRQYCNQIFRFAIIHEIATMNPAADIGLVMKPVPKGHYPSLDVKELPEFINALERNQVRMFSDTRNAIWLLMLTFVRTSELIKAEWHEFDFERALWTIPAPRMKMKRTHIVPLSTQVIAILQEQQSLNSKWRWVFPSQRAPQNHISDGTILSAIKRMGYGGRMTGHGFRALAMGVIKQELGYRHEVVDRQLAHLPKSAIDQAYDRADFLDERRVMMQAWSDYVWGLQSQPYIRMAQSIC